MVTAVLIGAGLRGEVYSSYALEHPDEFKVVAVAEPNAHVREVFAEKYQIADEMQFESYEQLLAKGKLADCAMVCTQDKMHYEPVIKALEKGYHVLCEKPVSPDAKEIAEMGKMAEKYNRIFSICHVLRYSPFFAKLKCLLDSGKIGRLMSIHHIEEVGYWHHAHSFVRGNWGNAEKSSPMILQKCCHDMDILLWLVGSACTRIQSFGDLTFFKEDNAPEGAPKYCLDGCAHRDTCPYYAPRFYLEHPRAELDGLVRAVTIDSGKEAVLNALKEGPYGRCVFHCDNTVVDHQVVNIQFENGVTAAMTMCAFTNECARKINLMGTHGQIEGDMEKGIITIHDFITGDQETIKLNTPVKGHSGADEKIMKDFVRLVEADGTKENKTSASISVDSHLMSLAAEESRQLCKSIEMSKFKRHLQLL